MIKSIVLSDSVFDSRVCHLGEGPLWHPLQERWYWFDILQNRLLAKDTDGDYSWQFDEMVSAAGWIDEKNLLIASETGLYKFNTLNQHQNKCLLVELESSNNLTRSNDGRTDPWGGFWIGTMGKQAEFGLGSIYRYYQGEMRKLVTNITISNAICFAHNKSCAYYTDTPSQQIMRQSLDSQGWPKGQSEVFVDLRAQNLNPDGAVVDRYDNLWNAQWGASRVACYSSTGELHHSVTFPAKQISCPAFGGVNMDLLLVTSAAVAADVDDEKAGMTFSIGLEAIGHSEYSVEL